MKNSNRNLRSASTCGKETWEMSQSHNSKDCERQKLVFVLIHATEILIKFYAEISDSFSFIFFWLCEVFVKLKTFLMSLARDAEKKRFSSSTWEDFEHFSVMWKASSNVIRCSANVHSSIWNFHSLISDGYANAKCQAIHYF